MKKEGHCDTLVSLMFCLKYADCFGLRLYKGGRGVAVGPPPGNVPTKICKLFIDSFESHVTRDICVVRSTLMESGCKEEREMSLYVRVSWYCVRISWL